MRRLRVTGGAVDGDALEPCGLDVLLDGLTGGAGTVLEVRDGGDNSCFVHGWITGGNEMQTEKRGWWRRGRVLVRPTVKKK